jgi:hypothetical protein
VSLKPTNFASGATPKPPTEFDLAATTPATAVP